MIKEKSLLHIKYKAKIVPTLSMPPPPPPTHFVCHNIPPHSLSPPLFIDPCLFLLQANWSILGARTSPFRWSRTSGFSFGASNFYSISLGKSPDKQTHLLRQVRTHPGQVRFGSCLPSEQAEIQTIFFFEPSVYWSMVVLKKVSLYKLGLP